MAAKVVDSSALACVIFGEPDAASVGARLRGFDLLVPALLVFELANVCVQKVRKHPAQRDALLAAHRLWPRLGVREVGVDLDDVVSLAQKTGLTAYDAAYLWLAEATGSELVTLDRALEAASRKRRR